MTNSVGREFHSDMMLFEKNRRVPRISWRGGGGGVQSFKISIPAQCSQGVWGSAVSSSSGVWGGAPAANDFGHFWTIMKMFGVTYLAICIENVYLKFNLSVWELTQGMLHNLFKLSVSIVCRNSFFGIRVSIVKVCMKSKPKAPTQPEATDLNSANKERAVPNWKCQRDQNRPLSIARKKRKPQNIVERHPCY